MPFIFNAFYTTKTNGVDSNKDVGLSLAICKDIVKAHNGEIWAENTPGKGVKFSFTLPFEEEK